MNGLLATTVDVLGTRFATAVNNTIMQDSEEPGTFDGRLIDSSFNFLTTSTGDFLEYSERR